MASPADVTAAITPCQPGRQTLWQKFRAFFDPTAAPAVCAVCLPPGARLLICDIPLRQQQQWGTGERAEAIFTQTSAAAEYLSRCRTFQWWLRGPLTGVSRGMRVRVLDLAGTEEIELESLRALG
jgi:hypothetical protein